MFIRIMVLGPGGLMLVMFGPVACARRATATPVQYLVVIFQENVSFDHYFATYPHAANFALALVAMRLLRPTSIAVVMARVCPCW